VLVIVAYDLAKRIPFMRVMGCMTKMAAIFEHREV